MSLECCSELPDGPRLKPVRFSLADRKLDLQILLPSHWLTLPEPLCLSAFVCSQFDQMLDYFIRIHYHLLLVFLFLLTTIFSFDLTRLFVNNVRELLANSFRRSCFLFSYYEACVINRLNTRCIVNFCFESIVSLSFIFSCWGFISFAFVFCLVFTLEFILVTLKFTFHPVIVAFCDR